MSQALIALLQANRNRPLDGELAARIYALAVQMERLVPQDAIDGIVPERHGDVTFARECMHEVMDEIKPLHRAHWDETEGHRHGLPFDPAYHTFIQYELAGRYVLFTLREGGRMVGNCAMYLDRSAHTQTLIATEDTLYLLPEARRGRIAHRFVGYVERALASLGAREICITVKTVNRAERFFRLLGYRHVENGLTKILEERHVQLETAEA